MNCILLRYGEIGLKSKRTRSRFEQQYRQAIEEALKRHNVTYTDFKNYGGRYVLFTENTDAIEVLKLIPGIQSISPAHHFIWKNQESLVQTLYNLAKDQITTTFSLTCRRVGTHPFSSIQIKNQVADLLKNHGTLQWNKAASTHHIEIRNQECFVYHETINGLGGLPPRKNERVLCLFSGGIDSPVAAVQMLKRGCAVDFCLINLSGQKSFHDVAAVYNYLIHNYAYTYTPKLYVVDGNTILNTITEQVPNTLRQIAIKIAFYQIGENLAKNHLALVTGEALSQKSSQTLRSLRVIDSQVSIPVLRPLIGMDKVDITKMARSLGTLHASENVKEYCSISEGGVTTNPRMDVLTKIPDFRTIEAPVEVFEGIIEVNEEPEPKITAMDSVMTVDIRFKSLQHQRPLKTDLSLPYPHTLDHAFSKEKKYLIVCDFGVRSQDVAFELGKKGITAAGITVKNYLKYFSAKK